MEGFVKNISKEWAYAMKRSIRPGGEVPLTEIYEQYGRKHSMDFDEKFIEWLMRIKLSDKERWKIVYESKSDEITESEKIIKEERNLNNDSYTTPMVPKKMEIEDVVNMTVRKAREVIPTIQDLNLLKYSYGEAKQLAGKDNLCRILYKRIQDLQMSR